ncbi:MAG: aldo/keto reductase [Actinobacteria bacterium]|nr:aldo/keto reductase [Actinomycetota bacterium]
MSWLPRRRRSSRPSTPSSRARSTASTPRTCTARGRASAASVARSASTGGLPAGFVLQTKLDRDMATDDFGPERLWRSLEESLGRLSVDAVSVLFLHDPEHTTYDTAMRAAETLQEMRAQGYASLIGISGGPVPLLQRLIDTGAFEALMTHNRYALLDQRATGLLHSAAERRIATYNAAVYGGGILATSPRTMTTYRYEPAAPWVLSAVDQMIAACDRYEFPIAAAALQFSLRNPDIDSTVVGVVSPQQLADTLALAEMTPPDGLLDELVALTPADVGLPF